MKRERDRIIPYDELLAAAAIIIIFFCRFFFGIRVAFFSVCKKAVCIVLCGEKTF